MKITKVQKRNNRRLYDIYIDDELNFSVSSKKIIEKFGLEQGCTFQPDEFITLKKEIERYEAELILLNYLKYRFRSKKEIIQKLKSKKISQTTIDILVQQYEEKGFINDENFAESLVLDLISRRPQGTYAIKQKLRQKGIDNEVIQQLADQYFSNDTEYEMAKRALSKLKSRYMKYEGVERRNKALAFLQRKGFSYSCAKRCVEEVLFTNE